MMIDRRLSSLFLFLAFASGTHAAQAQQEHWLNLGASRLIGASTESMIQADTSRGTVCAIRLHTSQAINLQQATIHFSNHQSMRVPLEAHLGADSYTRVLSLPGTRRRVESVSLIYERPSSPDAVPEVRIWGDTLPGMTYCPR